MKTVISQLALVAMIAPAYSQAPSAATYESGVMLEASALLPAESLRGTSYRVRASGLFTWRVGLRTHARM